ncbi:hypothetical protein CVT24_012025 [Panaeolus cyanescens]|uniref:Urea carboxylase n=1 Tax=Panaeolus cyanescens TaxID=181874 RepID=A0A409YNH6_9AGAR|nr:hypothetical protein CVT24_012025 [Panaeolus cyanescens]
MPRIGPEPINQLYQLATRDGIEVQEEYGYNGNPNDPEWTFTTQCHNLLPMYSHHKLLVANRGEIAVHIIQTAKKLKLPTLAIYTPSDALSPHVSLADEAVEVNLQDDPTNTDSRHEGQTEAYIYLSPERLLRICTSHNVTLVHPGYGFLSENADFAQRIIEAGIGWVGPSPDIIRLMGSKHAARGVAKRAGIAVVPGSEGLLGGDVEECVELAKQCGFPVLLKATAGGGGMGMMVCEDEKRVREALGPLRARCKALFDDDGVFLEKYISQVRHVEVQIFGDGHGNAVHMRERECSIQRRNQKLIEETPSPFCEAHYGLRENICNAAVELGRFLKYGSAGTIEFLVDDITANFYFLEMNTRIQVEHAITEQIHEGLDIVELMIQQACNTLPPGALEQDTYTQMHNRAIARGSGHAIEVRVYAENPANDFAPSPGVLQLVKTPDPAPSWLRLDTWVSTGTTVTPYFDPLLTKVVVTGENRSQAITRMSEALDVYSIMGPPNSIELAQQIAQDSLFTAGKTRTNFLQTFKYTPRAMKVISSGIDISVQDLPGRTIGFGVPRSGPMDDLAFSAANILVGNPKETEGLEIVVVPSVGCSFQFLVDTIIAVTGKELEVLCNGQRVLTWTRLLVRAGETLALNVPAGEGGSGFRAYLAIRGGFPNIPSYLGSKSASMGLGGYQGRSLFAGDYIHLGSCGPEAQEVPVTLGLLRHMIPTYPEQWTIHVLPGPHGDEEFITSEGIQDFYSNPWTISASSNRMGIRLDRPESDNKIAWARENGGEGGSHPSNILDNGYAPGTININGDTPVILTNEGPDMGGYLCMCTVSTAERWKLGQLAPGNAVVFRRVTWEQSQQLLNVKGHWLDMIAYIIRRRKEAPIAVDPFTFTFDDEKFESPILHQTTSSDENPVLVTFRQAGDSSILVEFGPMVLDIFVRARIHAFQCLIDLSRKSLSGVGLSCPCVRSILCHYDPSSINQRVFLNHLIALEASVAGDSSSLNFPGRRITFPIVLDDSWNREALERYMKTIRDKAVYLPSNIEYLAENNGLKDAATALEKLVESDWLVLGVGFYLACPFLIPIDPRCRLIGQKMNPSRTFTPRGAIGIAGPVAAIYPIESPGGYQLYGRTLPTWQTWGRGENFDSNKPWLLQAFDQIHFKPVSEAEYGQLLKAFDAGQYHFEIEPVTFSMSEHANFVQSIQEETKTYREAQAAAMKRVEVRETMLLRKWEEGKRAAAKNPSSNLDVDASETHHAIKSSLHASIWKIKCEIGDVITPDSGPLMILEAMKTEIPVVAGVENAGKVVQGFGAGVKEGAAVKPGDTLVVLA